MSGPCELPDWFGRNVGAWCDTVQVESISDLVDRHDAVVVHVDRAGLFSRKGRAVRALREAFAGRRSRLVVHQLTTSADEAAIEDEELQPGMTTGKATPRTRAWVPWHLPSVVDCRKLPASPTLPNPAATPPRAQRRRCRERPSPRTPPGSGQ
ncbi:hypothetical protein ACQPZX_25110 [Actinoplanes sp. CA-142083]|uniref:hypothetical protein n=1 Tax=Actinoplanes sp. CA-142083 TaxID=3239903 RepID=UPI003D92733F